MIAPLRPSTITGVRDRSGTLSPGQNRLAGLCSAPDPGPHVTRCEVTLDGPVDHDRLPGAIQSVRARLTEPLSGLPDHAFPDPLRVRLVRLRPGRHQLTVETPALCADEAGLERSVRDMVAGLAGVPAGAAPIPHTAAAGWWANLATSPDAAEIREFWRARANGWAEEPPAPSQPGKSVRAFQPRAVTGRLSGDDLVRLRDTSIPVQAWLLAAWTVVLGRLGEKDTVVLGVGTDLRKHESLAGCPGPLTPYLPVRAGLPEHHTLPDVARAVAGQLSDGAARAEWFSWDACVPGGADGGRLAAGFRYVELPAWQAGAVRAEMTFVDSRSDVCTLRLLCHDSGDAVDLTVEYDSGVPGPVAEFLPESVLTVINGALRRPEVPIGELGLVGPEQAERLRSWSSGATHPPSATSLIDAIAEVATRQPDDLAISCGDDRLSYTQLVTRVNQLAHHLADRGVRPGTKVAVLLPRSVGLVVALLAVLRAGGAYVPVAVDQPVPRIAAILAETGAELVLCGDETAPLVPDGSGTVHLGHDADRVAARPATAPGVAIHPGMLAYVVCTSGSTGHPKAVMVSHHGLMNYLDWARQAFPLGDGRGSLVHSPVGFDLTVTALFLPLLVGSDVTVLPESPDPVQDLVSALKGGHGYGIVRCTPTHLRAMLDMGIDGAISVRNLVVGGEPLSRALAGRWLDVAPETTLYNHYGPAEAVVGRAAGQVSGVLPESRTVPIGRPIHNTTLHVLGPALQDVPVGVAGELYIGGAGLAHGYARRPGMTAERFVPDPAGPPGALMYRTGDLARWLPDGTLEFAGRHDDQIQVRGHRVEPAEVERVLREHPDVHAAAVQGRTDGDGPVRLVGYVVPGAAGTVPVDQVRRFMAARLPAYMVPAVFVWIDELPVNHNGKLDRSALRAPASVRPLVEAQYVTPRGEVEQALAAAWAEALRLDRVGAHDNFFALGGDSILSILAASRAARRGLKVEVRHFFEHQTVAEMALVARRRVTAVARRADDGQGLLTPAQHWFFDQHFSRPGHFDQATMFAVTGEMDRRVLAAALNALADHHAAIRTSFTPDPETSSGWRRVTAPPGTVRIDPVRIDLPGLPDDITAAVPGLFEFDLTQAPLLRVVVIHGGTAASRRLLFVAHHLVVDFVSWRILLDDLATAYRQLAAGEPVALPETTTDAGEWSAELAGFPDAATDLDYWLAQSPAGLPPLPLDHDVADRPTEGDQRTIVGVLDQGRTRTLLRDVPVTWRAQVDDILLVALGMAVRDWTGHDRLHVAVEGHGRAQNLVEGVELHRSVGWFTSVTPMLLRLPPTGDAAELVAGAKLQLHSRPRLGLTYGQLRYLDPVHSHTLAALPWPEISYNYVGPSGSMAGYSTPDGPAGALRLTPAAEMLPPMAHPANHSKGLLTVNATVAEDRLRIAVSYSDRHHDHITIERLVHGVLRHVETLVDAHAQAGHAPLVPSDFPLLNADHDRLAALLTKAVRQSPVHREHSRRRPPHGESRTN
jgi:amino acid adenylation domain-containing protein/non-ribosomal peptide synthase protein (TIGR01720 family)